MPLSPRHPNTRIQPQLCLSPQRSKNFNCTKPSPGETNSFPLFIPTNDDSYHTWRRAELLWLRDIADSVASFVPDGVVTDNPADAHVTALQQDQLDEALKTCADERIHRRMQWKTALEEANGDGEYNTFGLRTDLDTSMLLEPADDIDFTSQTETSLSTSSPFTAKRRRSAITQSTLKRLFHAYHIFRPRQDVTGLMLCCRIVEQLLSVRKARLLRCLLRTYLDDVIEVLRWKYPSLSRRRANAFGTHLRRSLLTVVTDEGDSSPRDSKVLEKYAAHLAAIEDLTDALVPPCDDETFCGLQEFAEKLNAMTAMEVVCSDLIARLCHVLRNGDSSRSSSSSSSMGSSKGYTWAALHEAVLRVANFIACHFEGDDENGEGNRPEEEEENQDDDDEEEEEHSNLKQDDDELHEGWRLVLAHAVEDSKLLGAVCLCLSEGFDPEVSSSETERIAARRRCAAMTLRRLTGDPETLTYLRDTIFLYPKAWDYLLPALVDRDRCVSLEVGDAMMQLLDGGCPEGSRLQHQLAMQFLQQMLAAVDVATEAFSSKTNATATISSSSSILNVVTRALIPTTFSSLLTMRPEEQATMTLHRRVCALVIERLANAVAVDSSRRRLSIRKHAALLVQLLQYIAAIITVLAGGPPHVSKIILDVSSQAKIVTAVATILKETQRRSGGSVLVGCCSRVLSAMRLMKEHDVMT